MSQIFKRPPAVPVPRIKPSGWRLPAGEKKKGKRNRENEGEGVERERERKRVDREGGRQTEGEWELERYIIREEGSKIIHTHTNIHTDKHTITK